VAGTARRRSHSVESTTDSSFESCAGLRDATINGPDVESGKKKVAIGFPRTRRQQLAGGQPSRSGLDGFCSLTLSAQNMHFEHMIAKRLAQGGQFSGVESLFTNRTDLLAVLLDQMWRQSGGRH
jgi:hypothetical protein